MSNQIPPLPPLTMPPTGDKDLVRATRDLYSSIQKFYPNIRQRIESVLETARGGTGLSDPGANGNVLTSDGTNWLSAAPGAGSMIYPGVGVAVSTGSLWGTSLAIPIPSASGGTGVSSPGTAGNVLTSNGTAWTSAAAAGGSPTLTAGQVVFGTGSPGYGQDAGLFWDNAAKRLDVGGWQKINGPVGGAYTLTQYLNNGTSLALVGSEKSYAGGAETDFGVYVAGTGDFNIWTGATKRLGISGTTGVVTATNGFSGALTGNVTGNCSGTSANVTGTVAVGNGGTGVTSITAGYIPYGAGTSAISSEAGLAWDTATKKLSISGPGASKGTIQAGWLLNTGTWIDLSTDGPSGIGSGGAGTNPWVAYASASGQWFTNGVASGDINYRNTSGKMNFGTNNTTPNLVIDTSGNIIAAGNLQSVTTGNSGNQFRVNDTSASAGVRTYSTSDGGGLIFNHYYAVSGSPYLRNSDIVACQGDVAATQIRFFTKAYSANPAVSLLLDKDGNAAVTGALTAGTTPLSASPGNGVYHGDTLTAQTAGEAISATAAVYFKSADSKWYNAKADASATSGPVLLGMAPAAISSGSTGVILLGGTMEVTGWGLTAGAAYYVSAATAGAITSTVPSTSGNQVRVIGHAITTTSFYVHPSVDWGQV